MRPERMNKKLKGGKAFSSKADDFVSVARRLGADEDKTRFEKLLGKVARARAAPAKGRAKRSK